MVYEINTVPYEIAMHRTSEQTLMNIIWRIRTI